MELPLEQEDDRIFLGFALADDYGTTEIRFVVDYVCDTLRMVTITGYDSLPDEDD